MTANHTTNAERPKLNEWKVLLAIVLWLVLMEALTRTFATSISIDLRNTLATPEAAARIASAPKDARTILVVGNSLARSGVDLEQLSQSEISRENGKQGDAVVALFAPDGSSVVQWRWGLKRYFKNTGSKPDLILLFTGNTHLLDYPTPPETLGAYFVDSEDLASAFKSMPSDEDAARLLLGRASHLFANRDRVRTRIGYSYLPGFETTWPALTTGTPRTTAEAQEATDLARKTGSVDALEDFIAISKEMGAELHVFSVPMPHRYQIPQPVLELFEETNTQFDDLSEVPSITSENFPDDYHLDGAGAKIFTTAILASLRNTPPETK